MLLPAFVRPTDITAMFAAQKLQDGPWKDLEQWWVGIARRLGLVERAESFFAQARGQGGTLEHVEHVGGDLSYILFVLIRYWIPPVLPPAGRERITKHDPDYWLESEEILKNAVARLRELKPLIELLTTSNPLAPTASRPTAQANPVVEVELASMLEDIAAVAGSYGGPDYTSVIKNFDPIPLRQTQPFKHNKKNSAELWVVFLLREHFKAVGLGKDRYWPLIAGVIDAAGIRQPNGHAYVADELKSWWQKNWPRTYTQLDKQHTAAQTSGEAYYHDFEWFRAWLRWQRTRSSTSRS